MNKIFNDGEINISNLFAKLNANKSEFLKLFSIGLIFILVIYIFSDRLYTSSSSISPKGNSSNENTVSSVIAGSLGIGENIQIVSYKKYFSEKSIFINYLHNKYNSNCSKIASVVEISTDNTDIALKLVEELKVIAMQISAMKPIGIDENSIESKILEDEKDIILKQMNNVPDDKKDQIIEGKLNKFIKENTLLGQALITEPKKTVHSFLNEVSKDNNINLNIISMDLYTI